MNKTIQFITSLMAALMVALSVEAQSTQSIEIKPIKGEKWWGLVVNRGSLLLPFSTPFQFNTADASPATYRADMMLSNRGRYLWSPQPLMVTFDGTKIVASTASPDNAAPLAVHKAGRSLREAYLMCCHKNFPPKAIKADEMLFGAPIYELGGDASLLYTQADVEAFATMLDKRGAPKGTILLPQGWNSPTSAAAFDLEAYPAPKELIDHLHAKGMKVMLTVTPYVMAAGRGYQQSLRDGELLCDKSGRPLVFESRLGYTACNNLQKGCVERLNSALKVLQEEYGVDGFYFDCLDAIPLFKARGYDLERFLDAWHSVAQGVDVAICSTPTHTQLGSIASSVSPSRSYSWDKLATTLETAINAAVLGYSRTCIAADLNFQPADKSQAPDEELILRTAQAAALMPVAIIPYAVWSVENTAAVDALLALRGDIGPYVLELAQESVVTAEPIIRHLEYQFPRTGFTNCTDEYMIGNRYLVAPVIASGNNRMVRLPKGKWLDHKGRKIKGPRVIDVGLDIGEVAIFEADH